MMLLQSIRKSGMFRNTLKVYLKSPCIEANFSSSFIQQYLVNKVIYSQLP